MKFKNTDKMNAGQNRTQMFTNGKMAHITLGVAWTLRRAKAMHS